MKKHYFSFLLYLLVSYGYTTLSVEEGQMQSSDFSGIQVSDFRDLKICPGGVANLSNSILNPTIIMGDLQWWTTPDRQSGTQVSDPYAVINIGTYYAFRSSGRGRWTRIGTVEVSYYVIGEEGETSVDGNHFYWSENNSVTHTITQPGTDKGFTFDIYELDNSFNMQINGTLIATNEIEFQSDGTPGINIEFEDGNQYEQHTNPTQIWNMRGDEENPLIRVIIDENGNISLYGSKASYGPLYKLQPKPGGSWRPYEAFVLNSVTWNSNSDNTIVISQRGVGLTVMDGYGYGVKMTNNPCHFQSVSNPILLNPGYNRRN